MTNHLKSCGLPATRQPGGKSFHLFVEARYDKFYWMHLAVSTEASLERVDAFLRDIWLECCGHLSGFTIDGASYVSDALEMGDKGMAAKLGRVLRTGMRFRYEYDYGSTTELSLKVVGIRDRGKGKATVELLARNDDPALACQRCGIHPATQICTDCLDKGNGWLCESCAEAHECGLEMCLPAVNSPRAGVCGYTG
jgi:hypothetical protein